jgi:hypothetical protein
MAPRSAASSSRIAAPSGTAPMIRFRYSLSGRSGKAGGPQLHKTARQGLRILDRRDEGASGPRPHLKHHAWTGFNRLAPTQGYRNAPDTAKSRRNKTPAPPNRGSGVSEPAGDRTQDLRIKSPLLYQLSYRLVVRMKVPPSASYTTLPGRSTPAPAPSAPRRNSSDDGAKGRNGAGPPCVPSCRTPRSSSIHRPDIGGGADA